MGEEFFLTVLTALFVEPSPAGLPVPALELTLPGRRTSETLQFIVLSEAVRTHLSLLTTLDVTITHAKEPLLSLRGQLPVFDFVEEIGIPLQGPINRGGLDEHLVAGREVLLLDPGLSSSLLW